MKGLADEDYKEAGSSSAPTKGKSDWKLTMIFRLGSRRNGS
jgi:hypothetical protein